jgi:hypothetical protein
MHRGPEQCVHAAESRDVRRHPCRKTSTALDVQRLLHVEPGRVESRPQRVARSSVDRGVSSGRRCALKRGLAERRGVHRACAVAQPDLEVT